MHIPDSAISPLTSIAAAGAMTPIWYAAGRRLNQSLGSRQTPLLAMGAAFCFTIQMFNIPMPGGTTAHPTGGVLLAILMGPWAAAIGMTAVIVIQALFFGDGGVLAVGANSFTMAYAGPFFGYLVYRAAGGRNPSPRRQAISAALAAYSGTNAAAMVTALMLGIQPALFHDAAGRALYFPFGLQITIPAIMAVHLTLGGVAEAAVTVFAVRYVLEAKIPLYGHEPPESGSRTGMAWAGLAALIALSPLGLLATGSVWGEWTTEDLREKVGFVPSELSRVERDGWKGLNVLPDYLSDRGPAGYATAALAGAALVGGVVWILSPQRRRIARTAATGERSLSHRDHTDSGLPDWLTLPSGLPAARSGKAPRLAARGLAERSLADIAETAYHSMMSERWAREPGFLQSLDPRVKLCAAVGMALVATVVRSPLTLIFLIGIAPLAASRSRIPPGIFFRRVWPPVLLFSAAVALPSALSAAAPGAALLIISRDPFLAITAPGLENALLLALRICAAVSFTALIPLSTPWGALIGGMRSLGIPRSFTAILAMTYRYTVILMRTASDAFIGRRSRALGVETSLAGGAYSGRLAGALFTRAHDMVGEVHSAMLSRGWTGEVRSMGAPKLTHRDLWFAACALILGTLAFLGGGLV